MNRPATGLMRPFVRRGRRASNKSVIGARAHVIA